MSRRKKLSSLIFIFIQFFICYKVYCQRDSIHGVRFNGGVSITPIAELIKNRTSSYNIGTGLTAGIDIGNFLEAKVGGIFYFKKYTVINDRKYDMDDTTDFHCLNVPITLGFNLFNKKIDGHRIYSIYMFLGMALGVPVYDSRRIAWTSVDYMNNYNRAWQFGFRYKQPFKKGKFVLEIEPRAQIFVKPVVHGNYYEFCAAPYPCYAGRTLGNYSRFSASMALNIVYIFQPRIF